MRIFEYITFFFVGLLPEDILIVLGDHRQITKLEKAV